jgi:phage/plasmid-like protein (TIGR03299 family)
MPAGITKTDGMAYVGRVPWHKLGTKVEGDAMTAAEAIEAASMDWTVATHEVFAHVPHADGLGGYYAKADGRMATFREDTGTILGIVGNRYHVIQNTEAFSAFDAIVGAGDAIYQTVGTLWGGRKLWILAKLTAGRYTLDNGDALESYILLDNSHDGTTALRMRLTQVRVVCSNTLSMATGKRASFYARHTAGINSKISQARDLLGLNAVYMERFVEQCNQVAEEAFDASEMEALTRHLLDLDPDKGLDDQYGIKTDAGEAMNSLFSSGVGNKGETRWDAFNAVTEYLDYSRGYGNSVDSVGSEDEAVVEKRIANSWFGAGAHQGEGLRQRTWSLLQLPKPELKVALMPKVSAS